jgi:phosphoribosyl 1,2-cyclic phosphodiesterase
MMTIRFWGVRGSIPTGDRRTAQVGGNTSCVEVWCGPVDGPEPGTLLILDAGSGIRALGSHLRRHGGPSTINLLLSHCHWDHIQGFPFFVPAFMPDTHITVFGAVSGMTVRSALQAQMRPPFFPVGVEAMRANLSFRDLVPRHDFMIGGARIRTETANHPNGCLFYRIEHNGASVVYATDTEHLENGEIDHKLVELAYGADVLIYDAQYTPEEYAGQQGLSKRGWGHSTAEEGTRLAEAARVSRLVLFHHDPSRDDLQVARIEADAQARFPASCAAREGLLLAVEPQNVAVSCPVAPCGI